jgi:CspA family cold shock protein
MATVLGTVKWFNDQKGFGFLTAQEGGPDIFVHHSEIISDSYRTLVDGEAVEFELIESDKGLKAAQVKRLDPPTLAMPTPRQQHYQQQMQNQAQSRSVVA